MNRLALVVLLLLLAACAPAPGSRPVSSPSAASSSPTAVPSAAADCPSRFLESLTEPQRVGQLLFVGLGGNQIGTAERDALTAEGAGSVWYTELSSEPAPAVATTSSAVQALALATPSGTARVFVAANQEGGRIDQFSGPGFSPIPSALVQGQSKAEHLRADAASWGRELRAAGVNLEVAPVVDTVPPGTDAANAPIGALERAFGHDPATVSTHGAAFIAGMHDAGEPAVAKHFPGLGRVTVNTDFGASAVDGVTAPDDPYLQPFADAVAAGADMVMVSLALYPKIDGGRLAVFSPAVMAMLRQRFGFAGVIVSDDLGAAAAVQDVAAGRRAVDFVAAGGDLVTLKYADLAAPMASALLARAASDAAFRARVDESALRVLRLKARYGLLTCA